MNYEGYLLFLKCLKVDADFKNAVKSLEKLS